MNQPQPRKNHGQGHSNSYYIRGSSTTGELPFLFRLKFADFPEVVELSDGDAELTDPNLDHRH